MSHIINPSIESFDFSRLKLLPPSSVQGGACFTKFEYNNKPLYIQTCKCFTKQGIVKSGKRLLCDLMFDNTNEEMVAWFETFENKCYDLLYDKKDRWFKGSLEKEYIENVFVPTLRIFKSGKFYLVRANVQPRDSLYIYDENKQELSHDMVSSSTKIVSILEFTGIKFTSNKFQIEINLKQIMVIKDNLAFDNCLIDFNKNIEEPLKSKDVILDIHNDETIEENNLEESDPIDNESLQEIDSDDKDDDSGNDPKEIISFSDNKKFESLPVQSCDTLDEYQDDDNLREFDPTEELNFVDGNDNLEIQSPPLKIKARNEVYYDLYKKAREEAKEAKKKAIIAYLEAKNIKDLHSLDISDSDDSDTDLSSFS